MNAPVTIQAGDRQAIGRGLLRRIITVAEHDLPLAVAVTDAALELFAPTVPDLAPAFGGINDDAEWWAECASDAQIAAMTHACVKRIAGRGISSPGARKRALVAIWNALDPRERAAFLEFADPGAKAKA
jgi:hypothetical protein